MSNPLEQLSGLSLQGKQMDPRKESSTSTLHRRKQTKDSQGSSHDEYSESSEDDSPRDQLTRRSAGQQKRRKVERENKERTQKLKQRAVTRPLAPQTINPREIFGLTNIAYASDALSDTQRAAAMEGLHPQLISIDSIQSYQHQNSSVMEFQLKRKDTVSLSKPLSQSQSGEVKCTCRDWSKGACPHFYWLYDGINNATYGQEGANGPFSLRPPDVQRFLTSQHQDMLRSVPALTESLNFRGLQADPGETRVHYMSELVSVLDHTRLPLELHTEMVHTYPSFEELRAGTFVPGDHVASLWRLGLYDDTFFHRLRSAITPVMRAEQLRVKIEGRLNAQIDALKRYAESGRREVDPEFIPQVALVFRSSLADLRRYLEFGTQDRQKYAQDAVSLAVWMLQLLQENDRDIYDGVPKHIRITSVPSEPEGCNLFLNLFSPDKPSKMATQPTGQNDFPQAFVKLLANQIVQENLSEDLRKRLGEVISTLEQSNSEARLRSSENRLASVTRFVSDVRQVVPAPSAHRRKGRR